MAKKSQVEIRAFRAVSNAALASEQLPNRLKILDWGASKANDGTEVILDDISYGLFTANQEKIGRKRIALDFNHCTVPDTQAYKDFGANPTVFAYGAPAIVRGEGLFLEDIKWTPTGQANAKDFEDISPAPLLKNGRVIGIHSAALTTAGAINDLTFYSAFDTLDAVVKALGSYTAEAEKYLNDSDKSIKRVMDNPPVEYGSLEEEIKAITAKWAMKGGKNGPLDSPSKGTDIVTHTFSADEAKAIADKAVADAIKPLSAKLEAIETANKDAAARAEQAERDSLVSQATTEGKVIPLSADAIKTVPVAALREMVKGLPKAVVPTTRLIKPLSVDDKGNLKGLAKSSKAFEDMIHTGPHAEFAKNGRN